MAALTPVTIKGPFETIAANGADFTWTAGSVSTDTIACLGRDILLVWNTDAVTPYWCKVFSEVDERNRDTTVLDAYSLAAGDFAVFGCGLTNSPGWKDSATGLIMLDVENAAVKWAVLRLPTGFPG